MSSFIWKYQSIKKNYLKVCMTMLVTFLLVMIAVKTTKAEEITVGEWTYSIDSGVAKISRYNGTSQSVTIPTSTTIDGVKYKIRTVGKYAFYENHTLQKVIIPDGINKLEEHSFYCCSNICEIIIKGDLGDGNTWAYFYDCYNTFYKVGGNADSFKVVFANGVTRIPANLFSTAHSKEYDDYPHITDIEIADTVTEIGKYAFYKCYDLKNVKLGKNVVSIGEDAFGDDFSLNNVKFGDELSYIGKNAFEYCHGLSKVDLPKSVKSLGEGAFKYCTNLNEVVIRGDLGDCDNGSMWQYSSENKSVFYATGMYSESFNVTFANGVTRIPAYIFATAFDESSNVCAHITEVSIPSTVKEIGSYAFNNCFDLKMINSATAKVSVGENNFENCSDDLVVYAKHNTEIASVIKEKGYKVVYTDLSVVKTKGAANVANGIKVTWNKSSDAKGYYIYRKTGSGKYTQVKKIDNKNTTAWTDTSVKNKSGKIYTYCVKAYNGSKTSTQYNAKSVARLLSTKIALANDTKGVKVKWNKVAGADGYVIYRDDKKVKAVNSKILSYVDKSISSSGMKCTYKVVPYKRIGSANSYGLPSANKKIYYVKATTLKGTSSPVSKKMTIKWNKVSGVKGYQIQYSTSKNFKNAKTVNVSGSNSNSKTISGLTKNKTYYVRIRTFKKISGANRFSAWSSAKSRKI